MLFILRTPGISRINLTLIMDTEQRTRVFLYLALFVLAITTIGLTTALITKTKPTCDACENSASTTANATTKLPFSTTTDERTATPVDETAPWSKIRLPTSVFPLHYDIHLWPKISDGVFRGQVNISLRIVESTNYVIVHAASLNVSHVSVTSLKDGAAVSIKRNFTYEENQVFVIETEEKMASGDYKVEIRYDGSLLAQMIGFYRSSYMDKTSNDTKFLVASKFEPTYARLAFPCFDEPNLKATFKVSLTHEKHFTALSNMNQESLMPSKMDPNLMTTTFHNSKKMSTYLAVFIISEFESLESQTSSGIPMRVFARPDELNNTKYALQIAVKIKDYYEKYFDIPYPLPKQDLVAIPDFVSGAMENWGLITFRETQLLYNKQTVPSTGKNSVATTVAHELTHQWFGNLVTMSWWDDLWLNEGFATFFAYEGMSQLNESQWLNWRQSGKFLVETLQSALALDSNIRSHPIIQPVNDPDEITAIFDTISYKKGSSVIRMLESFMGQGPFQKGIQQYLKKYTYNNARTEDLWKELSDHANGINISKVMGTWTLQMGFPVVTVKLDGNNFVANQTRYLANPDTTYNSSESPYGYLWEIPLTFRLGPQSDVQKRWMHQERQITWLENNVNPDNWYKFNINQMGIYRVNYDEKNWNKLIDAFCESTPGEQGLSVADLTSIVDDSFALAQSGHLPYKIPMELVRCLAKREQLQIWMTASDSLDYITKLLRYTKYFPLFRKFVLNTVKPIYQKIDWNNSTSYNNRFTVIHLACGLEHPDCLQETGRRLLNWIHQNTPIPPDLRRIVFIYGMKSGLITHDDFDILLDRYMWESQPQTKDFIITAMASSKSTWRLNQVLELTFNGSVVKPQNVFSIISSVSYNPSGTFVAWNFFRSNWERFVERFTLNSRTFGYAITSLTQSFCTSVSISEMEAFYNKYPNAGAGARAREQALEIVKSNKAWIENRSEEVINWLLQNNL